MQYYTQENNKSEPTPAGNEFIRQYCPASDKKGHEYLKEIGKKNVYEMIQADKDNAVLYTMIEKYQTTGDPSILNTRETFYDNFLNIPSTPAERRNLELQAEYAFNGLDREVREAFNNDIGIFKESMYNGEFEKRMSKFIKKEEKVETQQQEVKQEVKQENNNTGVQL